MKSFTRNVLLAGGSQVAAMVATTAAGSWLIGAAVLAAGVWVGFSLIRE